MQNHRQLPNYMAGRQRGMVLYLGLVMLLVMTVLGIAGFQNSHIQERSAGNARLQSVAFEAAAAGASNAINFFDTNRDIGPDQLCGGLSHEGWDNPTDWIDVGAVGGASLKQRMYCLADVYPCGEDDVDCDVRPARSQLFILSRGEVTTDGKVVASRDIEIRLGVNNSGSGGGGGCGALCLPTCTPGSFEMPNSNSFQVDGNGGPALTGGCDTMTEAIQDAISDNRIGNYDGGIETAPPASPWDTPENVEAFRANLEATALAAQAGGGCMTFCYSSGDYDGSGNFQFGAPGSPQITYIEGNASMGGNISGAGIMFVAGELSWSGTPNFQGLIVTLGGAFTIDGGGHGGDHAGSVVILNQPEDLNDDFGESFIGTNGGGTALYKFECDALLAAQGLLDEDGQAIWAPQCDESPANPFEADYGQLAIISWRENIGWRETFFGSE